MEIHEQEGDAVTRVNESDSMEITQGSDSLEVSSGQHGEHLEDGEDKMDITRFGGALGGMMQGSYNSDFMTGQFDINTLSGLIDVDGIYGEFDVVLMEGGFIAGDHERDSFLEDLTSKKSLAILLNRRDNNFLRDDYEGQSGAPKLEMSFVLIKPKGACWHGGLAVLQMSIKNTGDIPAFDILALNKIPEHAAFQRFIKSEKLPPWLVRGYLKKENLLYWRLYQPLKPGETFKSTFMVKLDEWDVNDYSSDNENL